MRDRRKKLLWQLYPSYVFITLLALMAVGWYTSGAFMAFFLKQTLRDLEMRAVCFREILSEAVAAGDRGKIDETCKRIGAQTDTRITVVLSSGAVAGDSEAEPARMENHADREEIREALQRGTGSSIRFSKTLGERMVYAAVAVEEDGEVEAVVRAAASVAAVEDAFSSLFFQIVLAGVLIAFAAAGVSLYVSRRLSLPLERMTEAAQLFAKGELSHRMPLPETRELAVLADALNRMATQLDDRIKSVIRHRNELEAVLTSMKEGVIAMDREERILSINSAAAAMFDKDPWEMENRSIQEAVRNPALQKFAKSALENGDNLERDIVFYHGEERILHVHGTRLLDSKEESIGILVVINDVTQLRRLENMRRDFVANVSHEIKTPLTAIQGFVETLLEDADHIPQDTLRFLTIIERHVGRLSAIIRDLLNLSRIEREAERKEIFFADTPVEDVVQTAVQVVEGRAKKKSIEIDFDVEPSLSADMEPPLMEQAVVNLIDNAVKYSPSGARVEIRARSEGENAVLTIRDHGTGIPEEHLPRLFERFYRVDKARSRKLGGTGLGLAIVKHIVQAHGGSVDVESTPGKGSVFTLTFPRRAPEGQLRPPTR